MPLENANTISQLDSTWPLGLDSASRGDDHLRLLKAVLKAQFPGSGGNGFSKPITVTEDQLNALPQQVADMAKNLFPVGTVVLRMDATNPSTLYGGTWYLITGDATLTFGNGAAQTGASVGNNDPSVPLPRHTHYASFIGSPVADHTHTINVAIGIQQPNANTNMQTGVPGQSTTSPAGGHTPSGTVNIGESGTSDARIDVRGARIAINVWRRTA